MADDKPIDRRRFFRRGLAELITPLAKVIAPLEQAARQLEKIDQPVKPPETTPAPPQPPANTIKPTGDRITQDAPATERRSLVALRPPGALPEAHFLSACDASGDCVRACPVHAIQLDPAGLRGNGKAFIDVIAQPCTVCDGLYCMHACPTGALQPTPIAEIDMGTAKWRPMACVRTQGEDCTICVDRCPLGSFAIEVDGRRINVKEDGCTGCGVCEHACPTSPKSIIVLPSAVRVD